MKKLIFIIFIYLGSIALADDQYLSHYFGRVQVGMSEYVGFYLKNDSDQTLTILSEDLYGMFYAVDSDCPEVLDPMQKCYARIRYWPQFAGFHHGEFIWKTNHGNIYIRLNAEAY